MRSYISLSESEAEGVICFVKDSMSSSNISYDCPNEKYLIEIINLYEGLKKQGLVCLKTNKGIKVYNALENKVIKMLMSKGYKFASLKIDLINLSAGIVLYSVNPLVNVDDNLKVTEIAEHKYRIETNVNGLHSITSFVDFLTNINSAHLGYSKVFK